ncbi:MAG TPA: family 16 glycoside hydrolase [Pirellulales bacterium]|nr:family 16 glycoside hydrolase [Pirellulales bacterium]
MSLFAGNSLTGWDDGGEPAKGWRMVDGVLQGDNNSTPLVSGWSWGDVTLSFRWKVQGAALWRLRLLRVPDGETIAEIVFGEKTPSRGIVVSSSKGNVKMILPASNDGWRTATLTRHGGVLDLETAAKSRDKTPAVGDAGSIRDVPTGDSRFCLELALLDGAGALADLKAVEPVGEPLYNGKDLTGWWTPGNIKSWKPNADSIICVNDNGNYLRTEREFANFTLSLEYRMAKGGNSGIGIRTARDGWPSGDGMELQMLDEPQTAPITRHSTMAIYGNLEPLTRADRSQEWNRVVVKAEGYLISAWVNGVLVQHANTAKLPELRRRNLQGWIGLQDHGARTEFRHLRVLEAVDGLGLQAWYTPRPPSGSQLVLERLMNPERLAVDDGLGSGVVEASAAGKVEQILAELKGPAAVVTVSRTSVQGRLAFYFDGEAAPRLQCQADKLDERLPLVGQDRQPLLTYVPFHKSLKVTISGASDADYRFEYVTFPESVPLEDFADGQSCVARGLLPALSYRDEQLGWGTHREADPLPRAGKQDQKIEEQSQAMLVDLEGPGIVEWTKLVAAPSLLDDDELWLEVTADDESTPTISTPARYFFPGLAGGNYHNYVVTNRNGWTNMLAMPFVRRLTIAVSNRGRRPVHPVGVTVSYQRLGDSNDPRLARRLRGVFMDEADSSSERSWVKQSGGGRFIGLVTQYGKAAAGVDSLLLDGQSRDGWRSADWQTLLGIQPKAADERHSLSGRQGGFQWRFFLLAPPQFRESFDLRATQGPRLGNRLALFYMDAE